MNEGFSLERKGKRGKSGDPLEVTPLLADQTMVTRLTDKANLPTLQRIARETGFEIDVLTDRPGDSFPYYRKGGGGGLSYQRVAEGQVAIGVRRPHGEKDHSRFWEAMRVDQSSAKRSRRAS
jgi:hypothetical protein